MSLCTVRILYHPVHLVEAKYFKVFETSLFPEERFYPLSLKLWTVLSGYVSKFDMIEAHSQYVVSTQWLVWTNLNDLFLFQERFTRHTSLWTLTGNSEIVQPSISQINPFSNAFIQCIGCVRFLCQLQVFAQYIPWKDTILCILWYMVMFSKRSQGQVSVNSAQMKCLILFGLAFYCFQDIHASEFEGPSAV